MKKIFSLLLAVLMLLSAVPTAFAVDNVDYTVGTTVEYTSANIEAYTITVPALLAPGQGGKVTLQGTWPSDKTIIVTADAQVKLVNSINANDKYTLDIEFNGIKVAGNDTQSQEITEKVAVEEMPAAALFGVWSGKFNYNIEVTDGFSYYANVQEAIAEINNGTVGQNQTAIKEDASVSVYTDKNGKTNMVLLKDISTSERITPTKDVTINLNGKTLTGTNLIAIDTSIDSPVIITVDGRTKGSTIQTIQSGTNQARAIQVRTGSTVNVLGGTYVSKSGSGAAVALYTMTSATLYISDAVISSESDSAAATGISISAGSPVNIINCDISTIAKNNLSIGINNSGEATVSDCSIKAYANLNASKNSSAKGIDNLEGAELFLENCYVLGTHSGVQNTGSLYVDGGTYESIGHGGFYCAGVGTTVYIKNAISRECPIPEGYTTNVANGGGMYVGGAKGMDNNKVYVDNCEFYGSKSPFVLRDTAGEQNNSIYISNSTINTDKKIRIDNNTHKLYIGTGNNFTADNTTLAEAVVVTDETYIYNG